MKVTTKIEMPAGVLVDGRLPVGVDETHRKGSTTFEIKKARLLSPGAPGANPALIEVDIELDVNVVLEHRMGLRGSPNSTGIIAQVSS